jgi:diguanylate cyclase (GGDEF)-like protein
MLQRSWWVIILTSLVAIVVTLIASYYSTPIYRSTSRFIVSPNPAYVTSGSSVLDSLATLDKRSIIMTYAEVLNSPRIYQATLQSLNLSADALKDYSYSATVLPDTNIIEFYVQGPNPQVTAVLANGISTQAITYVQGLYQVYDMTLLDPPAVPELPISPKPLRDAGIALVIGLAFGTGLALVRELVQAPIENFVRRQSLDDMSLALERDTFEKYLKRVLSSSPSRAFSLCMIQLEGLGPYVHVLPQPALQAVLRNTNQILRNQLRGNDVVGRWSDSEFAVMLSETPGDAAVFTMGRVRKALSVPMKMDLTGEDLHLHPKIGIAEYRSGDSFQALITNTEWALEMAGKNNGNIYLL